MEPILTFTNFASSKASPPVGVNECLHFDISITTQDTDLSISESNYQLHVSQNSIEHYIREQSEESREFIYRIINGLILDDGTYGIQLMKAIEIIIGDISSWHLERQPILTQLPSIPSTTNGKMLVRLLHIYIMCIQDDEAGMPLMSLSTEITLDMYHKGLDLVSCIVHIYGCSEVDHEPILERPFYTQTSAWLNRMCIEVGKDILVLGSVDCDLVTTTVTVGTATPDVCRSTDHKIPEGVGNQSSVSGNTKLTTPWIRLSCSKSNYNRVLDCVTSWNDIEPYQQLTQLNYGFIGLRHGYQMTILINDPLSLGKVKARSGWMIPTKRIDWKWIKDKEDLYSLFDPVNWQIWT